MPRKPTPLRRASKSSRSKLFPMMQKGFHYSSVTGLAMNRITELYRRLYAVPENIQVEGFFDPSSYWYSSNGYYQMASTLKETHTSAESTPFMRFMRSEFKGYIDVYVYDLGIHYDNKFSAMVRMGGSGVKHPGDSDEILDVEELIETVEAAMIDDPLWQTRNRQMGMRALNPRRKNPGKGASVLGAVILGGIIGHSMKK